MVTSRLVACATARGAGRRAGRSPVAGTEHEEGGVGRNGLDLGGLHQLGESPRPGAQRYRFAIRFCNRRRGYDVTLPLTSLCSPVRRREHIETTERRQRLDALLDGERGEAAGPHGGRHVLQLVSALRVWWRQGVAPRGPAACGVSLSGEGRRVRVGSEPVAQGCGGFSLGQRRHS